MILPARISSEDNFVADQASRFKKIADWLLNQSVWNCLGRTWGFADMDLMATVKSLKCPFYYSWSGVYPEAWGVDSLAQDIDWGNGNYLTAFHPSRSLEPCSTEFLMTEYRG